VDFLIRSRVVGYIVCAEFCGG